MAYDFSNFLQGLGTSPEDEYQKMLAQSQQTPVSQTLLQPQKSAQQLAFGGGATNAAQAMQAQAANQLNESMAAKNNLASQRDAQMQGTEAQASQALSQQQAEEERKKQAILGLASMATGGFGLGNALGKAAGAIGGKAAGAAAGASAASAAPFNILNHYDTFI